uniref:uncharacterized protein isoform X2 n=1 Tax=Myxine glutinosa TaxID=7769 RepID=UPI00358F7504
MPLTVEQKTKVVTLWYETKSYVDTRRRFCREYDLRTRDGPTNCAIQRIVKHFEHKGTVHNQSKGNSGRPASVTKSQANIDAVRDSAVDSPKKSHRRRSQGLGIKPTSVGRILTKELKLFPYIISIRHKLSQDDMRRRLDMCNWLGDRMERYPNWINQMWFSDEAHFHLNGAINNHNNIFWGSEPPEEITERYLKGPTVTCFCAFNARWGMLGPYWFENDNSRAVTINGECYRAVLQKFHNDLAQKVTPNQLSMTWFMQDCAPPHTAGDTITFLQQLFRNHLVALGTAHDWAPHSPDLNPLDYWFWGAAKGSVYVNHPATLDDLKQEVSGYLQAVPHETYRKVGQNFGVRINACLNRGGAHIENINYKDFVYRTSAMPLLDSCERFFGTRDLYTVLSVGRDASDADLRRAYRRQALLVHPDRAGAAERQTATASFQVLSKVHAVLIDKEHRALYDEQGIVDEENDTITQDKDWDQYFRLLFKKITVADIRAFEETYRESEEERDDLRKAYLDSQGDMDKILATVLCARIEDEPRFVIFLETSIKAGDLPTYPAFRKESKRKREARRRRSRSSGSRRNCKRDWSRWDRDLFDSTDQEAAGKASKQDGISAG